jgi:hypothetical protein
VAAMPPVATSAARVRAAILLLIDMTKLLPVQRVADWPAC